MAIEGMHNLISVGIGSDSEAGSAGGSGESDGFRGGSDGADDEKARFRAGLSYTTTLAEEATEVEDVVAVLQVEKRNLVVRISAIITGQCIYGLTDIRDFERFASMVKTRLKQVLNALRRLPEMIASNRDEIFRVEVVGVMVMRSGSEGSGVADDNLIEAVILDPENIEEQLLRMREVHQEEGFLNPDASPYGGRLSSPEADAYGGWGSRAGEMARPRSDVTTFSHDKTA